MQPMPVLPINIGEMLLMVIVGVIILVPVLGITARFALKPIVEAMTRLRETQTTNQALLMLERRMDLMEQEMQSVAGIREDVAKLLEAQEFQLRLAAGEPKRAPGE
jgi:hypothetical protein